MELTVRDLLSKLNNMLTNNTIKEEDKVLVAHHSKGEGLKEDLYYWGLDFIYESADDDNVPDTHRKKYLVIEAYDEPL